MHACAPMGGAHTPRRLKELGGSPDFVGMRRWPIRIAIAVVVLCGAVAWGRVTYQLTNVWVVRAARGLWTDDFEALPQREVAIVPGVLFAGGRPSHVLVARMELALALYQAGRVKSILISGDELGKGHEVSGMRAWFTVRGVRPEDIIADEYGVRTLNTMVRAASLFGVRDAIICTQRNCAPRALFLARGAGIDAVAFVPKQPRPASARDLRIEGWKMTLAFVERYVLGRLSVTPSTSVVSMGPGD